MLTLLKGFPLAFYLALLLLMVGSRSPMPLIADEAAPTQTSEPGVVIASPGGGEALQGMVKVSGSTGLPGFSAYEVSFAYAVDPTNTWFQIAGSRQPVAQGLLAAWDTTTITDGTYRLRVQVFLKDGRVKEAVVEGLRVRNYSRIETSTPAPTRDLRLEVTPTAALRPSETPTSTPLPEFQPAATQVRVEPTNALRITPLDLQASMALGVVVVFAALAVGGAYIGLKRLFRR